MRPSFVLFVEVKNSERTKDLNLFVVEGTGKDRHNKRLRGGYVNMVNGLKSSVPPLFFFLLRGTLTLKPLLKVP